jgi:hypothetical protein
MPIELNLAGFNRVHETSFYTKFGYDPMKLKFLINLGYTSAPRSPLMIKMGVSLVPSIRWG